MFFNKISKKCSLGALLNFLSISCQLDLKRTLTQKFSTSFLFLNVCTSMSIGSNEVILISGYTLGVVKSIFKRFWTKKFFSPLESQKKWTHNPIFWKKLKFDLFLRVLNFWPKISKKQQMLKTQKIFSELQIYSKTPKKILVTLRRKKI